MMKPTRLFLLLLAAVAMEVIVFGAPLYFAGVIQ